MTENNHDSLPLKVELGASAKASFELKGEIPSASLGRLVDSLVDVIRPFTEARGLRADQLRLQREDVLYEIARKAALRLEADGAVIHPIPLKTIVPLLERASLEDPGGELTEWWIGLLSSTSTDVGLQHPVYSDVLARITAAEASYLKRMIDTSASDALDAAGIEIEKIFLATVSRPMLPLSTGKNDQQYEQHVREHLDRFRLAIEDRAAVVLSLLFPAGNVGFSRDTAEIFSPHQRSYQDIIDVLQAVGVLRSSFHSLPVPSPFLSEVNCSMQLLSLTNLGRRVLRACLPNNIA